MELRRLQEALNEKDAMQVYNTDDSISISVVGPSGIDMAEASKQKARGYARYIDGMSYDDTVFYFNRLSVKNKGNGPALLKAMLAEVNRAGIPLINEVSSYGEGQSQSSLLKFYMRYGFEKTNLPDLLIWRAKSVDVD